MVRGRELEIGNREVIGDLMAMIYIQQLSRKTRGEEKMRDETSERGY